MIRHVSELSRRIEEAFLIATSGRPGPVLVGLPMLRLGCLGGRFPRLRRYPVCLFVRIGLSGTYEVYCSRG